MKKLWNPSVLSLAAALLVLGLLLLGLGRPVLSDGETQYQSGFAGDDAEVAVGGAPAVGPKTSGPEAISAPDIRVWYGTSQVFGQHGNPQRWINILGNVTDSEAVNSLVFTLNGGGESELTIGPDKKRLADPGDFNAEIALEDLKSGDNEVVITAKHGGNQTSKTVTVKYYKNRVWPLPYYIDWSTVSDVQDVAQAVDGHWEVQDGQLRTLNASTRSYDRLVAIGDRTWQDYEITVPITFHEFFGSDPGAGVLVRWVGHKDHSAQPNYRVEFGALGWYRLENHEPKHWLTLLGNKGQFIAVDEDRDLELDVPYIFKMRAETEPSGNTRYSMKVWREGDAEPSKWDLSGPGATPDVPKGSLLLVAHRTDASFGNVTITPIQAGYSLAVTTDPQDKDWVQKDPDRKVYYYGDEVALTPDPDPGWMFWDWSGPDAEDVEKTSDNTWSLEMVKDRSVTANFVLEGHILTVNSNPPDKGSVEKTPDQRTYQDGEVVLLTPKAETGWGFAGWEGPNATEPVPKGDGTWSLTMDGDKELAATFREGIYYATVTKQGQGAVLITPGDSGPYPPSSVVYLEPQPNPGWQFGGWGGPSAADLIPVSENRWALTMDEDKELTATFYGYIYVPLVKLSD